MRLLPAAFCILGVVHAADQAFCSAGTKTKKLKNPQNPKLVCGFQGSLSKPAESKEPRTTFFRDCRDSCLTSSDCGFFSFKATQTVEPPYYGECTLYSGRIKPSKPVAGETGVYFWSKKCFKVAYYETGENVRNGDMEALFSGEDLWQTVSASPTSLGDGNRVAAMYVNIESQRRAKRALSKRATGSSELWRSLGNLCPGVSYTFSYDIRVQSTPQGSFESIYFTHQVVHEDSIASGNACNVFSDRTVCEAEIEGDDPTTFPHGTWETRSFNFIPQEYGEHRIFFDMNGITNDNLFVKMYVDNVTLQPTSR